MMQDKNRKKQGLSRESRVIITVCAVVVIALVAVIAFLLMRGRHDQREEPKRNTVINQENAEEIAAEMISEEYVEPGYFSTAMTTTWHFASGDAASKDAYVGNRQENTNDIYFDLFLTEDESEAILQSPIIPKGNEMRDIVLDKPLEAGTYECVMVYHLVDEEQNTVSTLRVGLTVIVES